MRRNGSGDQRPRRLTSTAGFMRLETKRMILMLKDLPENDKGTAGTVATWGVTDRMPLSSKSGESAVRLQWFDNLGKSGIAACLAGGKAVLGSRAMHSTPLG